MNSTAEKERRRDAFDRAKGSAALEGFKPTPFVLAIQEKVINGALTFDQAVAAHVAKATKAVNAA